METLKILQELKEKMEDNAMSQGGDIGSVSIVESFISKIKEEQMLDNPKSEIRVFNTIGKTSGWQASPSIMWKIQVYGINGKIMFENKAKNKSDIIKSSEAWKDNTGYPVVWYKEVFETKSKLVRIEE